MSSETDTPPGGYGSYLDLPEVREMKTQMAGAKLLTTFVARDQKQKIKDIERQLDDLARNVDSFYDLLGPRNWIYSGQYSTRDIEAILANARSPEEAEAQLIDLYRSRKNLDRWILRLRAFPELRARLDLIERAAVDYFQDRFDVCALVLVTVMDGFVNDFQPDQRRGLHTREADEMVAWNSVVGHHMGLSHVLTTFRKTIKKRIDAEVHEVYRNGIVHGSVVNYNNSVVATKAWNMLFAVADWAQATRKSSEPKDAKPAFGHVVAAVTESSSRRAQLGSFASTEYAHPSHDFGDSPVVAASEAFLDAWQRRNYGALTEFENRLYASSNTPRSLAGEMRERFAGFRLSAFQLISVHNYAIAAALVEGTGTINDLPGTLQLRWIYQNEEGFSALGTQAGEWRLADCSPNIWTKSVDNID